MDWGAKDGWGVSVNVFQNVTHKTIALAGNNIRMNRVNYVDIFGQFQGLIKPFTKIEGVLGNVPFLGYSLIFDAPKQEFVVINKSKQESSIEAL